MVRGICGACGCMFSRYTEGIDRVKDRAHGIEMWVNIANLNIRFRARDHAAAVIFAAGGRKRHNIHNGQCGLGLKLPV